MNPFAIKRLSPVDGYTYTSVNSRRTPVSGTSKEHSEHNESRLGRVL